MRIKNIFSIIFLSIFVLFLLMLNGFETSILNNVIKEKIEKKIEGSNVNFQNINFSLNLKPLSLNLQLIKPEIEFVKKKVGISEISVDIDLLSVFTRQYNINSAYLNLQETSILSITPLISQLNPQVSEISKKFLDGTVQADININFNNLKKTKVKGVFKNGTIQFYENFPFANNIYSDFDYQNSNLKLSINEGKIADLNLKNTAIILDQSSKDELSLKTQIHIDGKIDYLTKLKEFKNLSSSFLSKEITSLKGDLKVKVILDLLLNNDLSVKKIKSNSEFTTVDNSFEYILESSKEKFIITKFNSVSSLIDKDFSSKGSFFINNKAVQYNYNKKIDSPIFASNFIGTINSNDFESLRNSKILDGLIDFKINLNNTKGHNSFDIDLDLKNTFIYLQKINYKKEKGNSANLNIKVNNLNDKLNISDLLYKSTNSEIKFKNLILNNKYKIENFSEIKVYTPKNSFNLFKTKNNIDLNGSSIDLTEFVKSLVDNKKNEEDAFSSFFNADIKAKIKKVYIGNDELNEFILSGSIKKSEYESLNAFGSFSNSETASVQIFRNKQNNLETKLISDRSIPFLLGLNFTKGFSNGKLLFNSEKITNSHSISKVILENYYVKEMPILAELLSLTSFTGIIDVLTGKGVFFKKSYLELEKKDGIIMIKESYGTGDSLGYTIDGQINKDGFVSISGNLVPAYLLNDILRQVPIVGKIITGKQGDGIFGASFKIKGQPNSLKTTVNPIRTLTPRFIQRFFDLLKNTN